MKKRLIALVLCALTVLCILPVTAMAADTWDGTAVDTSWYNTTDTAFTISTGAQLAGLAKLVNEGAAESGDAPVDFSGKTVTLGADIDLGGHQWTPIGIYQPGPPFINRPFNGAFDGANHTISNLAIGTADSPENTLYMAGLFGEAVGGSFKNLSLESVSIYSSFYDAYVGALVAEVGGTVENCSSSGTVSCSNDYAFVGGLVSFSVGNLKNCHSSCDVIGSGSNSYVGGLISQISVSTITDCYATGDVTGTDYVGGLVGDCGGSVSNSYATGDVTCSGYYGGGFTGYVWNGESGSISACYATGSVTASGGGGTCIGGFVGYACSSISGCFATGDVTSTGTGASISSPVYVGGFIGLSDRNVAQCFAAGNVTGAGLSAIGGFAGCNQTEFYTGIIRECYAAGSAASGTGNDSHVGGLVGRSNDGTVQDSYARGAVSGSGTGLSKGGMVGFMTASSICTDCYFDTRDTGMTQGIGYNPGSRVTTGLTPDQMTGTAASGNMTGLDFSAVWLTNANGSKWYFPQLRVLRGSSNADFQTSSQRSVSLSPFIVTFDTGDPSETEVAYGYYTAVNKPADPTRTGYIFDGWYTAEDVAYDFGAAVTGEITLHAKWTELTLSSSDADGTIYTGGRVTLTPGRAGGTWTFDSAFFTREGSTFTALKAGTSTITYTLGGASVTYTVTIAPSNLPSTGQDFAWVWALSGTGLMLGAVLILTRRRRALRG